ncbi:hypothetical protein ANRL4_02725 [Anaerolineae bacterium]|nr:hypothetical protein ANRL4_02725 [Anaerolineae bacterium]
MAHSSVKGKKKKGGLRTGISSGHGTSCPYVGIAFTGENEGIPQLNLPCRGYRTWSPAAWGQTPGSHTGLPLQ